MSNSNNHGTIEISKALIGCLGVVIAAIIGGVFLLISVGIIQFESPLTIVTPTTGSPPGTINQTPQTDNRAENRSPTITPTSVSTEVPNPTKSVSFCYGNCWQYDDIAKTMTWMRLADGTEDVWQPSGEALQKIRDGYTAIFDTAVSGEIFACTLTVNGQAVKNDCDGVLYQIPPGSYQVTSANKDIGGFRWCPEIRQWDCK